MPKAPFDQIDNQGAIMDQDNSRFATSFFKLHYEVMETTSALMFLLQGTARVRAIYSQKNGPMRSENERCRFIPDVPHLNASIGVETPTSRSTGIINSGALAEQIAFKGWVEQVYNIIWESQFRGESYKSLQLPNDLQETATLDKCRPKMDVIGDLRLIRNDLIHTGVATRSRTGKCKILEWFQPGDLMVFSTDHVFDFLNQMGFMTSARVSDTEGAVAQFLSRSNLDAIACDAHDKRIISVRQWQNNLEDGSELHLTSVVFEDGVYIRKANGVPPESIPAKGDVNPALYDEAVDVLLGRETSDGRTTGPWIHYSNLTP